jgi:CubicO group peptidase (beta-lactamase class C family)
MSTSPRPIAALVLLLAGAPPPSAAQHDTVGERIRRIEAALLPPILVAGRAPAGVPLEQRMRTLGVPAVSVAVLDGGRLAWARAWGVRERGGAPVDTATLFQAASISKPVAGLAALRLVEQGRLDLDEDVNAKLHSWRVPENGFTAREKVTLRRLLSHSAGLTVHGFRGYATGEPVPSPVQVLDGAPPANSAPVRVDIEPGSTWRYSGGGTTVVQLLLEDVTGRPFETLAAESVLRPAGMARSTYAQPLPAGLHANAAVGHRADGTPVTGRWHTYPEQAAAGLWTTPSDLARLALEVQRAFGGEPGRIIAPATAREMLTVQSGSYGIGFGIDGEGDALRFTHGGANEGFRASFVAFAHGGRGAVIMTNGDNGSTLAAELLRAIAVEYGWPAYRPVERVAVAVPVAQREGLAGEYVSVGLTPARTLAVSVAGDDLEVRAGGGAAIRLFAESEDVWFAPQTGAELRFDRTAGGSARGVTVSGWAPQPVAFVRR